MSIGSVRAAFMWMLFALFLSVGIILNDYAHLYKSPYWDNRWTAMIMTFLIPYAWKIGFVILLIGMAIGLFLVVSHVVNYTRWIIRKMKKLPKPLTDRQVLENVDKKLGRLVTAVESLVSEIRQDRERRKGRQNTAINHKKPEDTSINQ
ncbi:hypothetical protein ACFLV0_07095 [Chloroflexota bacterium]